MLGGGGGGGGGGILRHQRAADKGSKLRFLVLPPHLLLM